MTRPDVAKLNCIDLLAGLDDSELEVVARWLDVVDVRVGEELTHEGAAGYAFRILAQGTADVLVGGEAVRTLVPGDFFGELSILGDGWQTATVRVTSPGVVWTMFGTRFRQLQLEHPQVAAMIERAAAERLAGR